MTLASAPTFLQPAERWSRVVVRLRTGVWDLQEQWGQQSHTQTQQCRQSPRGWCCQPSASPAKGSVSGTATQSYFTAARVCCSHDATLQGQEVSPPSLDAIWTVCAHSALCSFASSQRRALLYLSQTLCLRFRPTVPCGCPRLGLSSQNLVFLLTPWLFPSWLVKNVTSKCGWRPWISQPPPPSQTLPARPRATKWESYCFHNVPPGCVISASKLST